MLEQDREIYDWTILVKMAGALLFCNEVHQVKQSNFVQQLHHQIFSPIESVEG